MKLALSVFLSCISSIILCQNSMLEEITYEINFEDSLFDDHWLNTNEISHSEQQDLYKMDSSNLYGLGYRGLFPEVYKGNNAEVELSIDGDVIRNSGKLILVVEYKRGDSLLSWSGHDIELSETGGFQNKITIRSPKDFTKESTLQVYVLNEGRSEFTISNFSISFSKLSTTSFIPDLLFEKQEFHNGEKLFENQFFKIYSTGENLYFESLEGEVILNPFKWYVRGICNQKNFEQSLQKFKIVKKDRRILLQAKTKWEKLKIWIELDSSPFVNVIAERRFLKKNIEIERESIVWNDVNPTQLYLPNGAVEEDHFNAEYWLHQEGAKFGEGKNCSYFYHAPEISSFQLSVEKNQFWVNLDYKRDHPHVQFPLNDEQDNYHVDLSTSVRAKKETSKASFRIFIGKDIGVFPKIPVYPNHYQSLFIWTEHADYSDLRIHKAVSFGNEKINHEKESIGGFAKYHLPMTKSVFYTNPDGVRNSDQNRVDGFETEIANIKGTEGFLEFLKHLENRGFEIGLHTPDQNTSTREISEEALSFFKNNFRNRTWIDHGYNNPSDKNREDFVCDGLIKKSPLYLGDLWRENNVSYFWNPVYEDAPFLTNAYSINSYLNNRYEGFGFYSPKPWYWKNESRTEDFVNWGTHSVFFPEVWQFKNLYNESNLSLFAENHGMEIVHAYSSSVWGENIYWVKNELDEITIHPEFDEMLKRLSQFKRRGKIGVVTIGDYLDFRMSREKINYIYKNGKIIPVFPKGFKQHIY